MKIYRFNHQNEIFYGILKEEILHPIKGSIFRKFKVQDRGIDIGETLILPPVNPSKIVAMGRNYKDHAMERGRPLPAEPLIFLKPPSSIIGANDIIVYPSMSKRVDFEGELAVIIKKKAYQLTDEDDVFKYILGYSCFNDVTARDLQDKDGQWTRGKSFDTFSSIGPCIATDVDPSGLRMKTFLNGKLRQSGNTRNFIFPIPVLIRFISQVMTLLPSDIITTGTPAGIGPMHPGDRVDVQIEGIGTLSNTVMKIKH